MFTKRTIENLASLNDKACEVLQPFVVAAIEMMAPEGVKVEVISGTRSFKQQAKIYAQGRTTPGKIVTKAKPGGSWHQYGLAIDLGLFKDGVYLDERSPMLAAKLYRKLGELAAKMGVEWAGTWKSFPEGPHFQVTFGLTIAQALEKLKACDYDAEKLFA